MAQSALRAGDPARIGRYRLLARLGEGGMGVVYLGTSRQHGRVAIKVIHPAYAAVPDYLSRFQREVLALGRVQSVCTVRVIESDVDAVGPYLVTEYVEGPSLQEYVTANGPLDPRSLHLLGIGLAEALAAIHQAQVVHRDLKPSNVLVTPAGPKVIDFGVAKPLDLSGITHTNGAVGTPSYMAPEQFQGEALPATDVFAWGLTVAFAATGQSPFGGGTFAVLANRITNDDPDLGAVPEQLRALVASALAKDPAQRPTALNLLWSLGLRPDQPVQTTTQVLLFQAWRMPALTRPYTHPLTRAYTSAPGSVLPASGLGAPMPGPAPESAAVSASAPGVVPPTAGAGAYVPAAQTHVPAAGAPPAAGPKGPALPWGSAPPPVVPPAGSPRPTPPRSRRAGLLIGFAAAAAGVIGVAAALTANAWPGHPVASGGAHATSTMHAATQLPEAPATPAATPSPPSPSPTPTPTVTTADLTGGTGSNWTIAAIECPTPDNCTVVGTYDENGTQADAMFVVGEVNGTWGTAQTVPGLDTADNSTYYQGQAYVSCASAGNCALAADDYVANEIQGSWERAQVVPNAPGQASALSCAPDGGCTVGGGDSLSQAWTASEKGGVWTAAALLPGIIPVDGGGTAQVTGLVCADGGNCDLVGSGGTPEKNPVGFTDRATGGTWAKVQGQFNGTDYLGNSSVPPLDALSCSSFGNCGAQANEGRGWLYEVDGTWSMAPGSLVDFAISCPDRNWCAIATVDDNGNARVVSGSVTALADPSASPGA